MPTKKDGRGVRRVDRDRLDSFWERAGYSREFGCYLFGMQHGHAFTPFYVGKTARQQFERECFTAHKRTYFNEVLAADRGRRRPVLLLVVRTRRHRGRPEKDIDRMETWLIAQAKSVNPKLKNKSKVRPETWGIAGVVRSDGRRPTAAARILRRALGIAS